MSGNLGVLLLLSAILFVLACINDNLRDIKRKLPPHVSPSDAGAK